MVSLCHFHFHHLLRFFFLLGRSKKRRRRRRRRRVSNWFLVFFSASLSLSLISFWSSVKGRWVLMWCRLARKGPVSHKSSLQHIIEGKEMPPYCSSCSDGTGAPTTIARNSRPALTVSCGQWVLLAMPRWGTYTAHDHPTKERTHKRARNYSSFSSWQLRYVDISDTRIPQESPAISFNETQGRATRVQQLQQLQRSFILVFSTAFHQIG